MSYSGKTLEVAAFKNIHNVQSGTLTAAIISSKKQCQVVEPQD